MENAPVLITKTYHNSRRIGNSIRGCITGAPKDIFYLDGTHKMIRAEKIGEPIELKWRPDLDGDLSALIRNRCPPNANCYHIQNHAGYTVNDFSAPIHQASGYWVNEIHIQFYRSQTLDIAQQIEEKT